MQGYVAGKKIGGGYFAGQKLFDNVGVWREAKVEGAESGNCIYCVSNNKLLLYGGVVVSTQASFQITFPANFHINGSKRVINYLSNGSLLLTASNNVISSSTGNADYYVFYSTDSNVAGPIQFDVTTS